MKYTSILVLALIASTCKKEKTTATGAVVFDTTVHCSESVDSVYAFPPCPDGVAICFPTEASCLNDTLWKFPCFNPNNPNEICYIERKPQSTSRFLKYNILTGEKTLLYENITYGGQPIWCKNNWAYFAGFGKNVARINMSSGAKEMLTNLNQDRWVTPNIITGECMFARYVTNAEMYGIKIDPNGTVIDTVSRIPRGDWRHNIGTSGIGHTMLLIRNYSTGTLDTLYEFPVQQGSIQNIKIHPNNKDVYFTQFYIDGMYKVNIDSKELTLVKEGNNSLWYDNFSISQDGQKIVFEKVYCQYLVPGAMAPVSMKTEIWLMDIDGCNERKLNLDL
ncbi:MAG: hypothetical protein ACKVOR_13540 [Flavobacteriales bacterium]